MSRLETNFTKNNTHLSKFLPFHAFKIIISSKCLAQRLFKKKCKIIPLKCLKQYLSWYFWCRRKITTKKCSIQLHRIHTERRTISIFHGKVQRQWKRWNDLNIYSLVRGFFNTGLTDVVHNASLRGFKFTDTHSHTIHIHIQLHFFRLTVKPFHEDNMRNITIKIQLLCS